MISGCLSSAVREVHTAALVTSHLFAPGASVLSASLSVVHAFASEAEDAGGRSTWYLAFSSIIRRIALSIDISLAKASSSGSAG